jgi:hypothetical protein
MIARSLKFEFATSPTSMVLSLECVVMGAFKAVPSDLSLSHLIIFDGTRVILSDNAARLL